MIPPEQWRAIREDYVTGKGSLGALAHKHGLRSGTVERRAGKEDWTALRVDFERRKLARLLPPPLPDPAPPPAVVDGAVSEDWLKDRQSVHFRETARLLDMVRANLEKQITADGPQSPETIRAHAAALGNLAETEARLLNLRDRRPQPKKEKKGWDALDFETKMNTICVGAAPSARSAPDSECEPVPVSCLQSEAEAEVRPLARIRRVSE